ncbi:polysaccharide biosynthesis/export protein [Thioalkalivibrio nitratireducens DSM 14787]|uniref:Polysaccharide biosynthesis/export protein n=1 Tax=Thioalkalivibrio nitratireducens (strain DSM 14787 / UNIQEM 213 / ALEN2) TaxID=1255043 RepID=L0DTY0_THIND|nr:polysaccharide biosynthesis/export family protein [Thioalkalivibrio nitratireducens]AGA33054.1 polysaccharide biosynthesis/export protein [Thioalkalivibrio nitratireducens DSM 14787]
MNGLVCFPSAARVLALAFLAMVVLMTGCASHPSSNGEASSAADFQQQVANEARIQDVNEQLLALAAESGIGGGVYRVGAEDQIQVDIFGVPELSREYRVDGSGRIMMPLIGAVAVSGLTLDELEAVVAEKYGESYLRSPQVSARVTEFRSQQFTVVGAVSNPRVYSVSRQTTLIEALAMAGGVTDAAGDTIYLTDRVRDPESGALRVRTLLVPVDDLMRHASENNVALGESALINVPRGGFVYVEGAVNRPGAFAQRGNTTVLKALAEAGGLKFEANKSSMRILRRSIDSGTWEHLEVNYAEIRDNPDLDMPLENGDVVVVETDGFKAGWAGFWRNAAGLALLGFRPL